MRISFVLTGATPLLMHNDNIEGADEMEAWRKDPANKNISKPGDDRSPAWTWQYSLYSDGENVTIPGDNLMTCLRTAGTRKIMRKQTTYKEITQTGIVMTTEFLNFFSAGGKPVPMEGINEIRDEPFKVQAEAVKEMGIVLFMKRAKIGTSKHIRVRPRFDEWSLSGQAEITAQELTMEVLTEIFDLAGRVGLCDWRPGCKTPGPYGQFTAKIKKG